MSLHSVTSVAARRIMLCCISASGRFVVWRDMGGARYSCYLQDFARNMCTRIPGAESVSFPAHMNLEFTLDEERLVGSVGNFTIPGSQYVSVWDSL